MKLGKLAQTSEKILSHIDGEEGNFGLAALLSLAHVLDLSGCP